MAQLITPVRLGTTQNIDLGSTIALGVDKIDGVIVVSGMRILVKAQTNRVENGVYVAQSNGSLTRATDFANAASIECGTAVFIQEGLLLENTGWVVNLYDDSAATSIVVGTDKILFERFSVNLNLDSADIASAIVLRSVKGYPLTIAELDNNFKWISTTLNQKLNITDFNPEAIASKLNSLTAEAASLNAWDLRGLAPSSTVLETATESIVIRDTVGDIYTDVFHGALNGNAATASLAAYATLANNVDGVVAIANGGTGSITPSAARASLSVVGIQGEEAMIGKLTLTASTNVRASIRVPVGSLEPTTPQEGDIWSTSSYIRYFLNGVKQSVAHINSPEFTGAPTAPTASKATNNTTLANTAYVQLHVSDINAALDLKAPLASPALTGNPTAPTQSTSDNTTKLATTAFVGNKISAWATGYYTKAEIDVMHGAITQSRSDGDAYLQSQVNDLKQTLGIPVGSIVYYAANAIPTGYLMCDGSSISKMTYPMLFNKIGYTYGGSGNNFKLPDLRGEFIRGYDNGRGIDSGRVFGSHQRATGVRILLDKYAQGLGAASQYSDGALAITGSNVDGFNTFENHHPDLMRYPWSGLVNVSSNYNYITAQAIYGTGGGDNISFLTRPRNIALMPCIKAFGTVDDPDQVNAAAVLQTILNKVNRDGDTMTGPLGLAADPTATMHAATKQYVDNKQDMWGSSRKFVQSTEPLTAVDGDFWFKI